jgi:hypothetical protein
MSWNLAYIKANFCGKSKSIAGLETVGIQLCDAINIVKQTESELSRVQDEVAYKVNAKLKVCFNKILYIQPCVKFLTFYVEMKQNWAEMDKNFLPTIWLFSSTHSLCHAM